MAQRVSGSQFNFSSGELSPNAWERTDLVHHRNGLELGQNLVPLVTGPLASRPGFLDRGAAAVETQPVTLIPFRKTDADALMLEFSDHAMRVWTAAGNIVMSGGTPYVLDPGFGALSAQKLRWRQSGDVLFFTFSDGSSPPFTLERLADNNWVLVDPAVNDGPFLDENIGATILTFSGTTGAVDITASAPVFLAGHAVSNFRIRANDGNPSIMSWAEDVTVTNGELRLSDGKVYQAESIGGGSGNTGNTPLIHERGDATDGKVEWQFWHDGAGVVRITVVTDSTHAHGNVIGPGVLPADLPTSYWAEGAWSAVYGYPSAWPEIWEERLVMAATPTRPDTVDLTRTNGFSPSVWDFKPGLGTGRVVDDDAIRRSVAGGRGRIVWMAVNTFLMAGTTEEELVIYGSQVDEPLAPASWVVRGVSDFGSADVPPVKAHGALLHVAADGKTLREIRMDRMGGTALRDLSVVADHIGARGLAWPAWCRSDNLLWWRLADGGLACFGYHIEQDVMAWTRQALPAGWTVESVAAIPSNKVDHLWIVAKRTKGGTPQRRIWRMSARADGVWMDGASQYSGAPATVISGLGLWEGETVQVVADGYRAPDRTVAGGQIVLAEAASNVWVGQGLERLARSLPVDTDGQSNAKAMRPTEGLVFVSCVTAEVGVEAEQDDAEPELAMETISSRRPADAAPAVRRLKRRVKFNGGVDRDNRVVIRCAEPFDLIIYGFRAKGMVND